MDFASILGLLLAFVAILVGNALEGGHLSALLQPTALLIVLGGTVGATMLGFPMSVLLRAARAFKDVFWEQDDTTDELVEEMHEYAYKARREGIIALERTVQDASDPFLRRAMMMAIDGTDSKSMRENLELTISHMEEEGERVAQVWEAAGGYAPTIGIIGAVMGLIHVMQNLEDMGAVGKGIAVAFVATIYGVSLANLLFLPAAGKLKQRARQEVKRLEMIMEGALAIQEGTNPSLLRERLASFQAKSEASSAKAEERRPVRV